MPAYRPDPKILELGGDFYDPVEPAQFPAMHAALLQPPLGRAGRRSMATGSGISAASSRCRDNLTEPLALRYHGHQFRVYNPDIGDGRGFLFAQLREDPRGATSQTNRGALAACSISAPRARARRPTAAMPTAG